MLCIFRLSFYNQRALYQHRIFALIEVGSNVGDGFRHVFADVRKVALALNRLDEGEQFVANALAIELVEVAFVVAWVLSAHLEIVGFPPRSRHVDVAFCT